MIKKRIFYILVAVLAIALVIIIFPIKNSLYEYHCSYRIAQNTIVYVDIGSNKKTNVKEYIDAITKAVSKDEIICKKQKKKVFDAGVVTAVYDNALKVAKTSHNLITRASMLNTGYYKEIIYMDYKYDAIGCIYKDVMFYCTSDRFPNKYRLSECPINSEEAKKELSTCYHANIFFMQ